MINDIPQISVILSVFNGETYIARALLSILTQSYKNFELIVMDDGSRDRTPEIIETFDDPRLRFVRQKNMGLTKTLNKALGMARGKWIARHDADDFSIYTRFERQLKFLQENETVEMLGSSCFIQPEDKGYINEIYNYPSHQGQIMASFLRYNPFVHGSMMVKKKLIQANGGYDEAYPYVQDYELWSRLIPQTGYRNLSDPLYVRSVHKETTQSLVNKEPIFNKIRDIYLETYLGKTGSMEANQNFCPIQSISIYPAITLKNKWNKDISQTFRRMGKMARQLNLQWKRLTLQSFLYYPWVLGWAGNNDEQD